MKLRTKGGARLDDRVYLYSDRWAVDNITWGNDVYSHHLSQATFGLSAYKQFGLIIIKKKKKQHKHSIVNIVTDVYIAINKNLFLCSLHGMIYYFLKFSNQRSLLSPRRTCLFFFFPPFCPANFDSLF